MYCICLPGSDINYPMSDELLLCFIRARKYDLDRALKLVAKITKTCKRCSLKNNFLYFSPLVEKLCENIGNKPKAL